MQIIKTQKSERQSHHREAFEIMKDIFQAMENNGQLTRPQIIVMGNLSWKLGNIFIQKMARRKWIIQVRNNRCNARTNYSIAFELTKIGQQVFLFIKDWMTEDDISNPMGDSGQFD